MIDLKKLQDFELRDLSGQVSAELLKRGNRQLFISVAREFQNNGRIQAIKLVRYACVCGLKEAVTIVDYWRDSEGWVTIRPVEVFSTVPVRSLLLNYP
jgi:hypothetical protein